MSVLGWLAEGWAFLTPWGVAAIGVGAVVITVLLKPWKN